MNIYKYLIRRFGPRTKAMKKTVVNHYKLSTDMYTCVTIGQEFGPEAVAWWRENLAEYLYKSHYDIFARSNTPFGDIGRKRSKYMDTPAHLHAVVKDYHEQVARQDFITYMREKYGQ